MRKLILVLIANLWISTIGIAQAPDSLKFQAIVRDAGGEILADQAVGMQIMILKGSIKKKYSWLVYFVYFLI